MGVGTCAAGEEVGGSPRLKVTTEMFLLASRRRQQVLRHSFTIYAVKNRLVPFGSPQAGEPNGVAELATKESHKSQNTGYVGRPPIDYNVSAGSRSKGPLWRVENFITDGLTSSAKSTNDMRISSRCVPALNAISLSRVSVSSTYTEIP